MACPYFEPGDPVAEESAERLPLGRMYRGSCLLGGCPDDFILCNRGYARGVCASFPADAEADAFRFARSGGALVWIEERDHRPLRFGAAPGSGLLARQLAVFARNLEQEDGRIL